MMLLVRPLLAYGLLALLFFAAAPARPLWAQYQKYEGKEIANIRFDPARQPLDPEELYQMLPLKVREPLRMADVRAAIERLWATGEYADIRVDAQPYNGGVAITFRTRNSWFVGDVSVTGELSAPPSVGQLENAARLDLGAPVSEATLMEAVAGQQRVLESNGLYRNQVNPILDYDTGAAYQQVNILFGVASGKRAIFGQPVFTGDLKLDYRKILPYTGFRRWLIHTWKPVTQTRVRQAIEGIRSLYEKEGRLEAKIALDSITYDPATNRATATFQIQAGPRIQLNTIGAKVSQKQLRRYVPIFEEHTVDQDLLVEGARNLQDYFQSQGYFEAQVQFKQQRVANDQASIDFLINLGRRHSLEKIAISGNHYFGEEALRERMFLQTASFLQFPHGRYSESLLRRDEQSIISLYQSNGFRDVRVTHRLEDNYGGKVGEIAVFLEITEGPQVLISSLRVEGIQSLDEPAVLSRLSSVTGQPFSEFNVAVDRDSILAGYFEKGFPNATFEWSSRPAAEPNRVELRYVIREGQEQVVRQVVTTGLKITRDTLVNRNLTLGPGDPLSPTAMTDIQRRLYDLGVFAKVDAAIQNPEGETDRKYVLYNLEEARRYSVAFGFGADLGRIGGCRNCLQSPAGTTGFSPRVSLDFTVGNLWGVAHSISLRNRVSTLRQRSLVTYSWPRFLHNDSLNLSFTGLFDNSRDVRIANLKRAEASAQISQRRSKATTVFYRFAYRRVSVSNLKVTEYLLGQLAQPVRVGLPSVAVVNDRRDDPLEPHRGIYNTLDLGLAERAFGSQRNFARFLARNASYHPIGKKFVLARSTEFGDIIPLNYKGATLDAIPLPERFFGGGGTSHRGFPENEAGPRDPTTGFPLGGTALLFNQTELRFPLIGENIGGVLFHDLGNVYSRLGKLSFRTGQRDLSDFDYMVHALGMGVRYRTPIGPLRLDLAYSVNPPYFFGFKGNLDELRNAGVNPCANVPNQCTRQNVSHFQFSFSIGQTF